MKLAAFEAIVSALRDARVRYLVAGGIAVNAHGYVRLTYDVDLVIQLKPDNIRPAFKALADLGYRPTVPVTAEQFADPAQRARWIREKGMQVLNFHSDLHRPFTVDVFVSEPFDFDREYEAAMQGELAPGLTVRFVSIPALRSSAAMSREADASWETATWEGSRRAQVRSALALTVRERLQALEALAELAQRLAAMPRKQGVPAGK
jgi:hypothetical protein